VGVGGNSCLRVNHSQTTKTNGSMLCVCLCVCARACVRACVCVCVYVKYSPVRNNRHKICVANFPEVQRSNSVPATRSRHHVFLIKVGKYRIHVS
jgi:hypothetical protein